MELLPNDFSSAAGGARSFGRFRPCRGSGSQLRPNSDFERLQFRQHRLAPTAVSDTQGSPLPRRRNRGVS